MKFKEFLSEQEDIIDDKEKNINDWNNAGGTGILHRNAINTIEQLKKLGL